jgi:nucleoid-associated protein YgaU
VTDQLQRLSIEIAEEDAGAAAQLGVPREFDVQFNPSEYSLEKANSFAEITIPGLDSPLLQFSNGNTETLNLELLFDVTDGKADGDVRKLTRNLTRLARIVPTTHAPPRIKITWGNWDIKGVVESVSEQFILFAPTGTPVRSRVTLNLKRHRSLKEQLQELKLQSADHSKSVEVRQGDRLDGIAAAAYGDPRHWRLIADDPANWQAIPDPRRLVSGTVLRLPPLPPELRR